uniref:NADH dehydrogenase subunit 5 n=1 Tax=Dipterophagus daci TaxID=2800156 RepID=UPI001D127EC1|nr:NADH dehydrogenase subunit 5 [Dipterophagus daci]QZO77419.1 NADH dehydrogenase subunit 5 [Dipterophagus daci]
MFVISPNMVSLMLGWDGLGVVSFYLIGHYQNFKSFNASMVTYLMNRIGDSFMLLLLFVLLSVNSWDFYFYSENLMNNMLMSLLLLLSVLTKSAQFPFSIWLSMAMAAPTPVSALVHSSTLVTAGVFLIIRFLNYLEDNILKNFFYLFFFSLLYSSLSAWLEMDVKKVVALSTLSQLSMMLLMLSMGYYLISFIHLLIHALFKSMIFMGVGLIIHDNFNKQDFRLMGLYYYNCTFLMGLIIVSLITLCGIPFLSLFYSKDFFLEMYMMNMYFNFYKLLMFYFSIFMTMIYCLRLFYYFYVSFKLNILMSFFKNHNFYLFSLFMLILFSGSAMFWIFDLNLNIIILNKMLKKIFFFFFFLSMFFFFFKFIYLMLLMSFFYLNMLLNFNLMYMKLFINFMFYVEKGWSEMVGGVVIYSTMKKLVVQYSYLHNSYIKLNLMFFILIIMIFIFS